MNIALTDDLQRLLRKRVENGQFPDEAAAVREALRTYLTGEPQGHPQTGTAVQRQDQRGSRPLHRGCDGATPDDVAPTGLGNRSLLSG